MQAIRIAKTGGREVLQLSSVQLPKPNGSQTLVKNNFAGINTIDTYFRKGVYPHPLPMILGKEGAGRVVETGPESPFEIGDRVVYSASSGSYAQYTLIDTPVVVRIPDEISDELAAASFIQGLTAITLVEETYKVTKGEWVLVHAAAGGMGGWLVQILHNIGCNIIATASTPEKLEIARQFGAQHLINYSNEDVAARVKEIVPAGVHLVLDGVGKATWDASLASLRRKGFMASFGNASGSVPDFSILKLAPKCLKVARPQLFGYLVEPEEIKYYTDKLWKQLKIGIKVPIYKTYTIDQVSEAHEALEGRASTGKLLIRFAD